MSQPEQGAKTWRIVDNVVKHMDGRVTSDILAQGVTRDFALSAAKRINNTRKRKKPVSISYPP